MDRFDRPTADLAMLLYLAGVTAIMAFVGATLFWMMQPTVLPNPGIAASKPAAQRFIFQAAPTNSTQDMERVAIASAKEENAEQGIKTPVTLAAALPVSIATSEPEPIDIKPPPKRPKKKRVARVQKKPAQVSSSQWQPWGFGGRSNGGFWFQ